MKKNPWGACALIFTCAFLVRAAFYLLFIKANPFYFDTEISINHWLTIAQNLLAGRGYSEHALLTYFPVSGFHPTAARGPVPVFVLASLLCIPLKHDAALFIFSWCFSSMTAVFLYLFGLRIFSSEWKALAAAFLFCFYLPEVRLSTLYAGASESLFGLLLILYFMAAARSLETGRKAWAFGSGCVMGLLALSKPVVLLSPSIYAVWMLFKYRTKALPSLICFTAALFLCLAPWAARNFRVFGKPVLASTLGGYNLLRHNFNIRENRYQLNTAEDFKPEADRVIRASGKKLNELNETELDGLFMREARRIIQQYPFRYLKLCAIRAGWLWYKIGAEAQPYLGWNLVLFFFMFPGWLLAFRRKDPLGFLAYHWLYFILIYSLINGQFRFLCPLMPYGLLFAVQGFSQIIFRHSPTQPR